MLGGKSNPYTCESSVEEEKEEEMPAIAYEELVAQAQQLFVPTVTATQTDAYVEEDLYYHHGILSSPTFNPIQHLDSAA